MTMHEEYAKQPLRFADEDKEFWVWDKEMHGATYKEMLCDHHGQAQGCSDSHAVVSMGGTIIKYPSGYAINAEDASFFCAKHMVDMISFSPQGVKDAVTLALFEHSIPPPVIADVISQLDVDTRMRSIPHEYTIKEVTP